MDLSANELKPLLKNERFPHSEAYDPVWVLENEMGPSALWLAEWLSEEMTLEPGMRVLDMGCGKALSSVFQAREFGVQVWANDLWIPAAENWQRIREAGVDDKVYPIHAEAHALPYAEDFFDAIVSIDAYHYFGTDDVYLSYFSKFLRSGGQLGIVVPALMKEFKNGLPDYLTREQSNGRRWWSPAECCSFHTCAWWEKHWKQTELVDIELADTLLEGWRDWLQFEEAKSAAGINRWPEEAEVLRADEGRYFGFVRLVARKRESS
ncbi:MAG TPA: methyltransferase domain-containing protein [Candidatus Hydrogenedentes bacterium]|mgnify:FL=1|nr:methyltransferase domain-containing protein [Candidatus Hydrogenedentota bacterium]